jgi:hypothetical protein
MSLLLPDPEMDTGVKVQVAPNGRPEHEAQVRVTVCVDAAEAVASQGNSGERRSSL